MMLINPANMTMGQLIVLIIVSWFGGYVAGKYGGSDHEEVR